MNSNEQLAKLLMASRQPSYVGEPQYFDTTNYDQILADQNARNQQANAVNARLDQQQRRGSELTRLDELIAIQDKYKARKNAELSSPLYKEEQAKNNTKGLAQALLGTKQVESMSYGGNPVKQSPDGKYWLENNQEVTDVNNIQTNYKYDTNLGAMNAANDGNTLGGDVLTKMLQPKQGMDTIDKLALLNKEYQLKQEIADAKPKKDTDLKPRDINQFLTALGVGDYNDNDKAVLTAAAYEASNNPKKLDALSNALTSNSMHNYTPFMAKRWLSQDNFSKAMQAFQNK